MCPGDVSNQTLQETFVASTLYSIGIIGLFAMWMGTRSVYNRTRAFGLLALGVVMILMFVATSYFVLTDKIGTVFH